MKVKQNFTVVDVTPTSRVVEKKLMRALVSARLQAVGIVAKLNPGIGTEEAKKKADELLTWAGIDYIKPIQ